MLFRSGLETDFVRIAIQAGADIALGSIPEEIEALSHELANELGTDPLPEAEVALAGLDDRIVAAAASPETAPRRDYSRSPGT